MLALIVARTAPVNLGRNRVRRRVADAPFLNVLDTGFSVLSHKGPQAVDVGRRRTAKPNALGRSAKKIAALDASCSYQRVSFGDDFILSNHVSVKPKSRPRCPSSWRIRAGTAIFECFFSSSYTLLGIEQGGRPAASFPGCLSSLVTRE